MPTRLIHRALQNALHRWPAKLVLLGYVWMCCGGTLPATLLVSSETARSVAEKDRSVPFPCIDKPCGCRNAEQCYKSCCCSTKAERIAWAKEHAVSAQYIALADNAEEPAGAKAKFMLRQAIEQKLLLSAAESSELLQQSTNQNDYWRMLQKSESY